MARKRKQPVAVITGRVVHHFWLNLNKDVENKLDIAVRELKKQRLFAETIRDGLRLILDLRAGSLDVLFELFPDLKERMVVQRVDSPSPNIRELEDKIEQLTQVVLSGQGGGIVFKSNPPVMPKAAPPVAEIKAAAPISADDIADNFLSMFQ